MKKVQFWPDTLQVCYLAWVPDSWVDGTNIKEGVENINPSTTTVNTMSENHFQNRVIAKNIVFKGFGFPNIGGVPRVVASINSFDGTLVAPVSLMIANQTTSGFSIRITLQNKDETFQPWQTLQVTYLAWLDKSTIPYVLPTTVSGEIIIKYQPSTSMSHDCQSNKVGQQNLNVWATYIDREGINVLQKMKKEDSNNAFYYINIYRIATFVQFRVGEGLVNSMENCVDPKPSLKACASVLKNISFPKCGYAINEPGIYEIIDQPEIDGVPHPHRIKAADTNACPKHCSGHGTCNFNGTSSSSAKVPTCVCQSPWHGWACESLFYRLRPTYFQLEINDPNIVWKNRLSHNIIGDATCYEKRSYVGCSPGRCYSTGPAVTFAVPIDVLTEKQDLSLIDNPAMCTVSTAYSMAFASPDFPSYQMVQPIFNGIYGTENRQITPSVDISILHDIANSDDDSLSTATCNWGVDKITINCISWLQNLDIKCPSSGGPSSGSIGNNICSGHGHCIPCNSGSDCAYTCDCYKGYELDENRSCTKCSFGYVSNTRFNKCFECPKPPSENDVPCNGQGICTMNNATSVVDANAICECKPGDVWHGKACDQCDLCGMNGVCTGGRNNTEIRCQCKDRFNGPKCEMCEPYYMKTGDGRCVDCPTSCDALGICTIDGGCECANGGNYPNCNMPNNENKNNLAEIITATICITIFVGLCIFATNYGVRRYLVISKYKQHKLELTRELLLDHGSAQGLISDQGFGENAKDWTIRYDAIKMGIAIGVGSVGKVFKGIYAGENVAIKKINQGSKWDKQKFFDNFRRETRIMSHLHHPNIVRFFGVSYAPAVSTDDASFLIVTELCMYSLGHLIRKKLDFPKNKYNFILQIAQGIQALHNKNILHRDLKPDNVLIDKNGTAKLCDFGVAKEFQQIQNNKNEMTLAVGTPVYMAPELTKTCTPNKKVDIYSFGITINSYFAMREPYYNMEAINPFMLMERIYNGQRPEIAHCMEQELVDLVIQCWSPTSEQRPSINEILQILKSYGT